MYVTGLAKTQSTIADSEFKIEEELIKLDRKVEIYQWQETEKTSSTSNSNGSKTTTKKYSYHKVWKEGLINSNSFKKPEGHKNPSQVPYMSFSRTASKATLGDYELSKNLKSDFSTQPYLNAADIIHAETLPENAQIESSYLYIGDNSQNPKIGHIKISWHYAVDTNVSIVAQQLGKQLTAYQSKSGKSIEILAEGIVSVDKIFADEHRKNRITTWLFRLFGVLLCCGGFGLILQPLAIIADIIPFIGEIVALGTGIIAWILCLIIGIATIAVAWFAYRPILSSILVVLSLCFTYFIKRKYGKRKEASMNPRANQRTISKSPLVK